MDKLEKFVEEHRDQFEDREPHPGHFGRFEDKLDLQFDHPRARMNRSLLLKIAAGLVILMAVSVFLFDFAARRISNYTRNEAAGKGLSDDMQEAVDYYDDAANLRLNNIQKLACCGQDTRKLYTIASGELDALESNGAELKKALKENPGDERVQSALIRNQQMKEKVMNNMIRKMQSAKK